MGDNRKIFGYPVRNNLFPGEDSYFRQNRATTGMAAEDGHIILNPYSGLAPEQQDAVMKNEAARLYFRENQNRFKFDFDPTPEQQQSFRGTPYENDPYNMRATIVARILSGDPSAGAHTERQKQWADWILEQLNGRQ